MFLTTTTRNLAQRLLLWLQRRWSSNQWLVDRHTISAGHCQGLRPRVLISRSLCLYYSLDLAKIPASRRQAALGQQVRLLSPFTEPGFYARWQGGVAQLWLWDQNALVARLPQAAATTVLPDSALAEPQASGEYWLAGIQGVEWQQWQHHKLQDSRWQMVAPDNAQPQALNLLQATQLQAADRRQLMDWGLAGLCLVLILVFFMQLGGVISLWQQQQQLQSELIIANADSQAQFVARRQARQAQEQWLARNNIVQPSQLVFIQQLAQALPEQAHFWQRYQYEPGRIELQLKDKTPDPRDYVRRLSAVAGVNNVQVQLDPGNERVVLQANLDNKERQ